MQPTNEFTAAVRKRITELTGVDPGEFRIGDIFPGTNPNVTEAEMVEGIAQSMVSMKDAEEVDPSTLD